MLVAARMLLQLLPQHPIQMGYQHCMAQIQPQWQMITCDGAGDSAPDATTDATYLHSAATVHSCRCCAHSTSA
jgi:hypothetical protein